MASALQCCARFGIVLLVILNLLTLVLGVGLIVVAIYLKNEIEQSQEDKAILEFLAEVDLGSFTLNDLINIIIGVVIGVGAFAILTSLIGGIGAICKIRCLLITYVIILILCILLELVVLGFWVYLMNTVNDFLMDKFNDLMKDYNGPLGKDVISAGWNVIFIVFRCCGVKPVTSTYNDFKALPTDWWTSSDRNSTGDVIPTSCCHATTLRTSITVNSTDCSQLMVDYHTSGCYDVFDDLLTKLAAAAISISTAIIVIEAIAVFFSCLITCFVNEERNKIV